MFLSLIIISVVCGYSSFLFTALQYSIVWICHKLYIWFIADGKLSSFPFMNKATIKILSYYYWRTHSKEEFWGLNCIPIGNVWEFQLHISLPRFSIVSSFKYRFFLRDIVDNFNIFFWSWSLFNRLISHSDIPFYKVQDFSLFFYGIGHLKNNQFIGVLYMFWIQTYAGFM